MLMTISPRNAEASRVPRTPETDRAWRDLLDAATARYQNAGRFAYHFARGKLGRDPVFRHMLELGLLPAGARIVDIGCGQGLLASLVQACADSAQQGHWPASWGAAPAGRSYFGVELMQRDVARAEQALAGIGLQAKFVCDDMCQAPLPAAEVVVILDVLHYVDHAAQEALLTRVRASLRAGSSPRLLLRVGDAANTGGFDISQWVDRIVTTVRGHRVAPTWGRSLPQWVGLLAQLGFQVQVMPMSQGTPFANVLLIADLPSSASPATGAKA
jgi:SAM-dependent methyltransferase